MFRSILTSLFLWSSQAIPEAVVEVLFPPTDCLQVAKPGDHLLVYVMKLNISIAHVILNIIVREYRVYDQSGETIEPAKLKPNQLFHLVLENSVSEP